MLKLVLSLALLAVLILIVVRRRHLTLLMSVATVIGSILVLIWLQDLGLLPGTQGPLTHARPQTLQDLRR